MTRHFQREWEGLKKRILSLSAMVEERVRHSIKAMLKGSLDALVNLDVDLAYKICLLDDEVDDIYRDVYMKTE